MEMTKADNATHLYIGQEQQQEQQQEQHLSKLQTGNPSCLRKPCIRTSKHQAGRHQVPHCRRAPETKSLHSQRQQPARRPTAYPKKIGNSIVVAADGLCSLLSGKPAPAPAAAARRQGRQPA